MKTAPQYVGEGGGGGRAWVSKVGFEGVHENGTRGSLEALLT